jgi:hypothetical protein
LLPRFFVLSTSTSVSLTLAYHIQSNPTPFQLQQDCGWNFGKNFGKIADIVESRSKSQVRSFYTQEVLRINRMLAPLSVQLDPSDGEKVFTVMNIWHRMKEETLLRSGGSWKELCKIPREKSQFAWDLKKELDKSVWTEGKKEVKLVALGLLPAGGLGGGAAGGDGGGKAARRGSASPNAAVAREWNAEAAADAPMAKEQKERLMLQLFPIDAPTRASLVAGGFNPHLKLTFRAKKSVTGMMQHLATKWAAALPHLPIGLDPKTAVLQLYPFEAPSAAEATGVWNGYHDGLTAMDIFNALGRPAAFRVRYGWVPPAEAATHPHLPPPLPPAHAQPVPLARGSSRAPAHNLSPRKRSAEEMAVAHPSFCQAPVQAGAFGGIFGGGGGGGFAGGAAPVGSVFGSRKHQVEGGAGGLGLCKLNPVDS